MEEKPKRKYLIGDAPQRGLLEIVNLQTDQVLLIASEDIQKDIIHTRFLLDLEMYPNKELQQQYTSTGLELFSIEPYLVAKEGDDLAALLARETQKLADQGVRLYRS